MPVDGQSSTARLGALVRAVAAVVLLAAAGGGSTTLAAGTAPDTPVRIGIVRDGDWSLLHGLEAGMRAELEVLARGEFEPLYPPDAQRDGRWNLERIEAHFRELLADDDVDLVIALGLAASQIACLGDGYDKPVIAPLSLDFEIQNLPREGPGSGVRNLSYVGLPSTLRAELEEFRALVPFRHVALLVNAEVLGAMPEIVPRTLQLVDGLDLEITYVPAGRVARSILERIPGDADAVYVWPLLLDSGEQERLIDGLERARLPTFSAMGREDVERGMFATLTPDRGRSRLARRVALNIQQILLGAAPETLPVDFSVPTRLIVNVEAARRIGVSPRFELLLEAELVGDPQPDGSPPLTISEAVERAVAANLGLFARRVELNSGAQDVREARAALKPSLDLFVTGLTIDDDRAAATLGSQAEHSLTGSLAASQLIYSDRAFGNATIQSELQHSRDRDVATARLDVALETATSFLNLLRAETLFEVRRSNLELTRSNLELARTRRAIGTGGSAEVFRWESQIAEDRRRLVEADASRANARIALNRVLHEPLERRFRPVEVTLDDPTFSLGLGLFDGYIETPKHFAAFREFVVGEGIDASPALAAVDATIRAQRRALTSARRSFWAPAISVQAGLDELLDSSGAGSTPSLPGAPDDTDWSVGVNASLALTTGGARRAELLRARLDLRATELRREALAESIEGAIRSAMITARASYTAIGLAQASAEAADKNLELVRDAYARGAVSVIDLIDAQNSALSAELNATDAVYDFFIDLMRVQRNASSFDFFVSREAREDWTRRLHEYFDARGIRPWGSEP